MKKGICLTAVYPRAMYDCRLLIELFNRVAAEKVFQCVEFYFEGTEREEEKIRGELGRLNLTAVFLAGYPMKQLGVNISAASEEERAAGIETCGKLYERAVRMGVDKMLILSGPAWRKTDQRRLIAQVRKSLLQLSALALPGGPEITLEFFNNQGEPWLAVGDIGLVKDIYTGLPGNKVGITFDTSHAAQMRAEIMTSFKLLQPWIHHLHLANCVTKDAGAPLFGDKHPLFDVRGGDFSREKIREIYVELAGELLLEQVDICSVEVISRENEEECYREIGRQARYIWEAIDEKH